MKYILLFLVFFSCSESSIPSTDNKKLSDTVTTMTKDTTKLSEGDSIGEPGAFAQITKVLVSGQENSYSFSVTISSPDTGCKQYADWWEVVNEDGNLIYRRILAHSHVSEQPFTRSGGTVKITANQSVWVIAHMNNNGYGTKAMFGSPNKGFVENNLPEEFTKGLDQKSPLPSGCAF